MTYNTDRLTQLFKADKSAHEAMCLVRDLNAECNRQERFHVNRYVELGRACLELKEKCIVENKGFHDELNRAKVTKQRASEAMRLAQLPAELLNTFLSMRQAMDYLTSGAPDVENEDEEVEVEREPGEEVDDQEPKWAENAEKAEKAWIKKVDTLFLVKDITGKEKAEAGHRIQAGFGYFRRLAKAPYRPVEAAEETTCKKCGQAVLKVTSTKGKRFYVVRHDRGRFRLEGGLAIHVPKGGTELGEFMAHFHEKGV